MEEILKYFSINIRIEIERFLNQTNVELEEIRIRANKPISLKLSTREKNYENNYIEVLNYIVTAQEILDIFSRVCENSVYSYKKQICEGFITIKGGHRVGITGNCVFENGQVININYISSLNFRIAREEKGCSLELLKYIIDVQNKSVYNTLIVSKPGCGKTTMLRDIIRNISNGIPGVTKGKTCGVIDERGEIAAMYKGVPQNDVGILTDVLDNVSKSNGMTMLVRSMSPEVIFCDEIGSKEDVDAINYAVCSGIKGIFTAHGGDLEDLLLNKQLFELLQKFIIERIVFLSPTYRGFLGDIYNLDKSNKKYIKFK
jgi:stage III sporulation protein AA